MLTFALSLLTCAVTITSPDTTAQMAPHPQGTVAAPAATGLIFPAMQDRLLTLIIALVIFGGVAFILRGLMRDADERRNL